MQSKPLETLVEKLAVLSWRDFCRHYELRVHEIWKKNFSKQGTLLKLQNVPSFDIKCNVISASVMKGSRLINKSKGGGRSLLALLPLPLLEMDAWQAL